MHQSRLKDLCKWIQLLQIMNLRHIWFSAQNKVVILREKVSGIFECHRVNDCGECPRRVATMTFRSHLLHLMWTRHETQIERNVFWVCTGTRRLIESEIINKWTQSETRNTSQWVREKKKMALAFCDNCEIWICRSPFDDLVIKFVKMICFSVQ